MATLAEWEKFVSNVPEAQREYRTLEVWHEAFSQPYRYVASYADESFPLETGAPRNAGQTVNFLASTLQITEPAERQDSEQSLAIVFGNVDGRIHEMLDLIKGAGYFTPAEVIYRKYYSGDRSNPVVSPLYLFASGVTFQGPTAVSVTAEEADLSQKRAGIIYTLELFPGLAR